MSDKDHGNGRIYGAPDEDNRQPAPEQGMRGEEANVASTGATTRRTIATPDGEVTIEEGSAVDSGA
ncbi:hypothetical protein [Sphingomonas sp. ID0503]|uniref:hypothetical protein n=1 Tax=Sphingomonas sp. ID0503 TaxID=3399691 RepID=UPI003AFA8960